MHKSIIAARKFAMDPGAAGSLASRFLELLEKETVIVDPYIRTELVRQLMKPLLGLEIRGGKWASPKLEQAKDSARDHYRRMKEVGWPKSSAGRKIWKQPAAKE